jgi:hypothetical protein
MTNRVATIAAPTKMPVAAAAATGKKIAIGYRGLGELFKSTLL